jgi:hypothetical protein
MKTAISIDDGLMREADAAAKRLGFTRSRLFSIAVSDYLRKRRDEQMLSDLNEVYRGESGPGENRLRTGMRTKFRKTIRERW